MFPPIFVRSTIISHLHIGLPIGLFLLGFLTKILYAFLSYHIYIYLPYGLMAMAFLSLND